VRGSQEIDGEHDLQVYDGLSYSTETSQNLLEVNAHIKVLF
jgi:hypothetical protein